jgi:NAD(P)H-quinone oxidoreductase subunit 5
LAASLGDGAALASGATAGSLLPAGLLVALSAALKSAMFPTHGWLIEVMETPTPVSALLHAGIINGGTFLVVRLGEVMLLAPAALWALIAVGAFTAFFGSVVLTTQNSVKVALAYSSAAHMGFMLMLCGLGAFPVAILHLVAHSFYKAHAFLSSGSAVEMVQGAVKGPDRAPGLASIAMGMLLSVGTLATFSWLLGIPVTERPVTVGLAAILVISLTQLWTRGVDDDPRPVVLGRTLLAASGVTLAFFTLESLAARILIDAVPLAEQVPGVTLGLMSGVVLLFAGTVVAQLRLPALRHSPRWAGLWVHLRNGLYANTWFDRLVGTLRLDGSRRLSAQGR